jgi:hypothetical protein
LLSAQPAGNSGWILKRCRWQHLSGAVSLEQSELAPAPQVRFSLTVPAFHKIFAGASRSQNLYQCQAVKTSVPPAPSFRISLPVLAFHNLCTSVSLSQSLFQVQSFTISFQMLAFLNLFFNPAFPNIFSSESLLQSLHHILILMQSFKSLHQCLAFI